MDAGEEAAAEPSDTGAGFACAVAAVVVVGCIGGAIVVLRSREGREDELISVRGVVLILALVAGVVTIAIGVWLRQAAPTLVTLAGLTGLVASVFWADDLHWRWSRNEFEQVAAGDEIHCASVSDCRVGWWDVEVEPTRTDSFVIIWYAETFCEAGEGLVKPVGVDPGARALMTQLIAADLRSDMPTVHRFHDGWYTVCLGT